MERWADDGSLNKVCLGAWVIVCKQTTEAKLDLGTLVQYVELGTNSREKLSELRKLLVELFTTKCSSSFVPNSSVVCASEIASRHVTAPKWNSKAMPDNVRA
jgi:hypothetical protein